MRMLSILAVLLVAFSARADGTTDILPNGATTFTISAPGSYRLSQNVTMTTTAICIDITADDVTLDLNGHTLTGIPGGGNCIDTKNNSRLTISNGTIKNFGGVGIFTTSELRAKDLTVRDCGASGISAEDSAEIRNVLVIGNQGYGIVVTEYSLIESCRVLANGKLAQPGGAPAQSAGLKTGNGSTITNCVVRSNSPSSPGVRAQGILTGNNCTITGNTSTGNNGDGANGIGIRTGSNCVITGNTASENIGAGRAIGLEVGSGSTVTGNTCSGNSANGGGNAYGINAVDWCVIRQNTCTFNEEGPNSSGDAFGILAGYNCVIESNTCSVNRAQGADGTGYGISVIYGCTIRGNVCDQNTGNGTGVAYGIYASATTTIENNVCTRHGSNPGRPGYGIFLSGASNVIRSNSTVGNLTAGIRLNVAGNRSELNRTKDAVSAVAGNSLGAGDLADITF